MLCWRCRRRKTDSDLNLLTQVPSRDIDKVFQGVCTAALTPKMKPARRTTTYDASQQLDPPDHFLYDASAQTPGDEDFDRWSRSSLEPVPSNPSYSVFYHDEDSILFAEPPDRCPSSSPLGLFNVDSSSRLDK